MRGRDVRKPESNVLSHRHTLCVGPGVASIALKPAATAFFLAFDTVVLRYGATTAAPRSCYQIWSTLFIKFIATIRVWNTNFIFSHRKKTPTLIHSKKGKNFHFHCVALADKKFPEGLIQIIFQEPPHQNLKISFFFSNCCFDFDEMFERRLEPFT